MFYVRFYLSCLAASLVVSVALVTLICGPSAWAIPPTAVHHRVSIAAARLALRPALILPGQWQSPAGPVLVRECFASYPETGKATELLACLTQPDPRRTDRRVMTIHQYHLLHVAHVRHTATQ